MLRHMKPKIDSATSVLMILKSLNQLHTTAVPHLRGHPHITSPPWGGGGFQNDDI